MPKVDKQKPTPEEVIALQRKSVVENIYKSTLNWINQFEKYHKDTNLPGKLSDISDSKQLEEELCKYFTVCHKANGDEYSVTSLQSAINAFNQYFNDKTSKIKLIDLNNKKAYPDLWQTLNGKIKTLSASGYGETNGSDALTIDEVQRILLHPQTSNLESPGIAETFSIPPIFDIIESYDKYIAKCPPNADS
ncbi:15791_t:CDS:2 [Racocetra fulgida]|uniref:15791_t:CDS:1 n=1 Tax=Racocetra fulgida TaxID=60492 RepID=A0A9N8VV45_9GLOM|nr:15791_t:CDS:2 [Racocetra fulgida]